METKVILVPRVCTDKGLVRESQTKSAALFRLLSTQTIEAPKKRNRIVRVTNIQKEKLEKDDSEKKIIKLQFP